MKTYQIYKYDHDQEARTDNLGQITEAPEIAARTIALATAVHECEYVELWSGDEYVTMFSPYDDDPAQ